jgi:hypothetical protein
MQPSLIDDSYLPEAERFAAVPTALPVLQHELRVVVDVDQMIVDPGAGRCWSSFTGGRWTAKWGQGTVLVGQPKTLANCCSDGVRTSPMAKTFFISSPE